MRLGSIYGQLAHDNAIGKGHQMRTHGIVRIAATAALALAAAGSVGATAAPALAVTGAAPASARPDYTAGNTYKLVQTEGGTNYCLVLGASELFQKCTQGANDQKWVLQSTTFPGQYKWAQYTDGHNWCLDGDTVDGVFQVCSPGDGNQEFQLESATGGTYKIFQHRGGNKWCLDYKFTFAACSSGDGYQRWTLQSA